MHHETTRQIIRLLTAAAAAAGLLASPLSAHHSTAEYDATTIVEGRGEVVGVIWRNPHVRFQISTKAVDGNGSSGTSRARI